MFKSKNQNIWHKKGIWKWNEKMTSQKKSQKILKKWDLPKLFTDIIHKKHQQKSFTEKIHRNKTHKNDWQKWDAQKVNSQK